MKYLFSIIFLIFNVLAISQNKAEDLLESANELYISEKYEEAVNIYEQILNRGKESAEVYFNLGNACYKIGDINNAILNYERALVLAPHDEDIKFNLRIANQYVVDNIEELPKPFFLRWHESVVNKYPTDTWALFSAASFIIFLILVGGYLFSRSINMKRYSFILGIIFIIVSAFTFSFASKQKQKITIRDSAIVFCPRVTVKSSPSESGTDLFLIHEGLKVQITDSLNNWKEIKLLDGNQGWLPDSCIVKI